MLRNSVSKRIEKKNIENSIEGMWACECTMFCISNVIRLHLDKMNENYFITLEE